MSAEYTGILIDPDEMTITTIKVPERGIAAAIGCDLFDVVRLDDKHDAFVDDEGLLKPHGPTVTVVDGYPNPLIGKVLILCHDDEGETLSCEWTVAQVRERLSFGFVAKLRGRIITISKFGVREVQ